MKELITQLGTTLGIPDLALDEDHYCCLFFDELVVNLEWDPDTALLFIYAHCGTLTPTPSPELLSQLLEANFFQRHTDGATLGIDRDSATIALCQRLAPQNMDYLQFEQTLERFVHTAQTWNARIRHFEETEPGLTDPTLPPPSFA